MKLRSTTRKEREKEKYDDKCEKLYKELMSTLWFIEIRLESLNLFDNTDMKLIQTKLEKLMDIVESDKNDREISKLEAIKNINIITRPQCLYCWEKFDTNTKIMQCINGHLICFKCKQRSTTMICALCKEPMEGRAFAMESHIENLIKIDVIQILKEFLRLKLCIIHVLMIMFRKKDHDNAV